MAKGWLHVVERGWSSLKELDWVVECWNVGMLDGMKRILELGELMSRIFKIVFLGVLSEAQRGLQLQLESPKGQVLL
jgi:hypothetical protein